MTLRKTKRHSKRRRARSKKTRRTYKMRGGFKFPKEGDRIMYFRYFNDAEGYPGTIKEINKDDGAVTVEWDGYVHPPFPENHWVKFVQNYYLSNKSSRLESQDSVTKNEGTAEIFPQIAYLKPPTGTMWQRLSALKRSRSKKSGSRK